MTLFQITAVDIDDRPRDCCRGAVRSAGIGRAGGFISADEVRDDRHHHTGEYYAMVDGRYREVIAIDCPGCGEPYLTTETRFASRNELHLLPPLSASVV